MYEGKSIAVVVPAYNVETLVLKVIDTMPAFVDRVFVVDDCSLDGTRQAVAERQEQDPDRVLLVTRERNGGVGAAIASGYRQALDEGIDVVAVMAGDYQMAPEDLHRVVGPVCRDQADYVKGNRLFRGESWEMIPKVRYFGNSFLSLLTKIASGYWHVADSQTGYTAISRIALERICPEKIYPRYGMPNDVLIKLNIHNFRVRDVSVRPVYNVGEKSGIKLRKVVFTIPMILLKGFWNRLFWKYVILDFHPLVFFYLFGLGFWALSGVFGLRVLYFWLLAGKAVPPISALAAMFCFISATQFTLFGMWFDMESNKNLR